MPFRHPLLPGLLVAFACLSAPVAAQARCALADEAPAALRQWKAAGFAVADAAERNRRVPGLAECLDNPDPFLRDGIAFEALSTWMRGGQLDGDVMRALGQQLLAQLDDADAQGFRQPFAALALSELARTDRLQPWMTNDERARMVEATAAYLRRLRDYRGYIDGEGWRHGVAHGSDWALQLVLNDAVDPGQVMSLLSAVGTQVMPADGHAYAFGEPARLARPVAYAVAREDLAPADVAAWLAGVSASLGPRPEGDRQARWWTRRANLENFLHALAILADGNPSPGLDALADSVRKEIRALP